MLWHGDALAGGQKEKGLSRCAGAVWLCRAVAVAVKHSVKRPSRQWRKLVRCYMQVAVLLQLQGTCRWPRCRHGCMHIHCLIVLCGCLICRPLGCWKLLSRFQIVD